MTATTKLEVKMKDETRIALLEQSIHHINESLLRIEKRFDQIDKRLDRLEQKFVADMLKEIAKESKLGTTIEIHMYFDSEGNLQVTMDGDFLELSDMGFDSGMFNSLGCWIDYAVKRVWHTKGMEKYLEIKPLI